MEPKIRFSSSNILYEEKTLSEISTINPKTNVPLEFEYVDLESVSGTEMTNHRTEHKATAPSRAQRLAKKGDIFYQTVRPYQKNNYYFDMDDDNYVFSTGYAQIRPSIYGKYLFTLLQNDSFLKQVLDNCAGTSFPAINPSVLSRLSVRICKDKQEQQAIASYFTSLDSQISASTSRLASLKQMKAASLQAMFPQEGETVPKIRFKGFEGEWKKVKFSELYERSSIKNDLSFGTDKIISVANMYFIKNSRQVDDDYLRSYNIMRLGDIAFEGNKSKNFAHGRLVENTIGDGIVSHVFIVMKPISKNYDLNFWKYYINNENIMGNILVRSTKSSTMMTDLVVDDFLKESILVPSYEEQIEIGKILTSLDRQISLQSQRLEKLKQIKSACLDKMFV